MNQLDIFGISIPVLTTFQSRINFIVIALVVALIINALTIVRHFVKHGHIDLPWWPHFLRAEVVKPIVLVMNCIIIGAVSFIVTETLLIKPEIIATHPQAGSVISWADEPIRLDFNVPVAQDTINFHVSPEVTGEWVWQSSQQVTFYPKESFFPDSRIIVYVVGIRPSWHPWRSHEQAIELEAPAIPNLTDTTPKDAAEGVPVEGGMRFTYDKPVGKFIDLQIRINPDPGPFNTESQANVLEVTFENPLQQDQQYTVEVHRTPRSYNVDSNEDVSRGETELIKTFSFKTVATPLIASFEPRGTNVLPNQAVKVEFDQQMDQQSVIDHFSINPSVAGNTRWENSKTLIFTPTESLAKDTTYELIFSQGMVSEAGGKTDQDIKLEFTTIGKVDLASSTPFSGSSGIEPTTTNVTLEFNQNVDHASVEERILFVPPLKVDTTWEGNKLILKTAGKLDYSSRYRIIIQPGIKSVDGLDSDKEINVTFATKDNIFSISVPYYRQQELFTCNLAAAEMVLAFRGITRSEDDIRNAIGIGQNPDAEWVNGYGVHIGPIADYLNQHRSTSVKREWNVPELLKEVQQGNPVIAWVYNRYSAPAGPINLDGGYKGYNGMHSEVVVGFIGRADNPTHILTNDPWRGKLTYSRAQFESMWSYMGNSAIVVY